MSALVRADAAARGSPLKTLVLGGGFAGLAAAIQLALDGHAVTLLEQNDALGGKAGELRREGFRFDTGPSVLTLPEVLTGLFAAAGEPFPLLLEPLEPLCRYLYPSGRVWDVYRDIGKTTAQLSADEARSYRALLAEAERLYETSAPTFVFGDAPGPLGLLRYGLRHGLRAHPALRLPQLLARHRASDDLMSFFLRFATYFGADPYRAPAVIHNIAWVELGLGVVYPETGVYGVVEALAGLARRLGVELRTGVRVTRLEVSGYGVWGSGVSGNGVSGSRVTEVVTDAGSFRADAVVSALDLLRTRALLGRAARRDGLEPSLSGFVLLLGVAGTSPLEHHTVSFPERYALEFEDIRAGRFPRDPTLYLNLSCKTDPEDAPAGCENWFVMTNAPALTPGRLLDEAAYAEHLLGLLERRGLLERSRVRFMEVMGPRHLASLATFGSIYGSAPHSLLKTLRAPPRVKGIGNLVLAGGTVHPGGGIPLALLSGKRAALELRRL